MSTTIDTGDETKLPSGIDGLDDILRGGSPRIVCISSPELRAPARRPSRCSSCSKASPGRALPLRHALGNPTRNRQGRAQPRLGPDRPRNGRARALRTQSVRGRATHGVQSVRDGARRDDRGPDRRREQTPAAAARHRFAVRAAADRAERPALSPAGPRAQAVLRGRDCTVLMLDDRTGGIEDDHLQSIAHGVVMLEQLANQYGAERRRAARQQDARRAVPRRLPRFRDPRAAGSTCFRASSPRSTTRISPTDSAERQRAARRLLGGGLPAGTSTLLLGPAGTGKSTVATQFAAAAAARGDACRDVRLRREHRHVPLALAQARHLRSRNPLDRTG